MNPQELRATSGLALIYVLRMLGLFMVLPVLALYAGHLEGVTPVKIGLAIGAYGLTQALLQMPYGMASDRIGRKPVIVFGLLVFAAGSLLAGLASDIDWVIAGRALQGAGAIAAAVSALLADLTRDSQRTRAMLILGISIGTAFAMALILGPLLASWFGVAGIFLLTAGLALCTIPVLLWWVPPAPPSVPSPQSWRHNLSLVLADPVLLRLDAGIFILHALLTASFVALPLMLRDAYSLAGDQHWKLYLPVMLVSLFLTFPLLRLAEQRGRMREAFLLAIAVLGIALSCIAFNSAGLVWVAVALSLFFAAFNLLEATLPSWVSRCADPANKGAALGVYSSAQFMGAFCGGAVGGWVLGAFSASTVLLVASTMCLPWLLLARGLQPPAHPEANGLADSV